MKLQASKRLASTKTLSTSDRDRMVSIIMEKMKKHYAAHGEEGDFADGERYLLHDASAEEVIDEYTRWNKK